MATESYNVHSSKMTKFLSIVAFLHLSRFPPGHSLLAKLHFYYIYNGLFWSGSYSYSQLSDAFYIPQPDVKTETKRDKDIASAIIA